jgi:hypothetical protein
MDDELCLSGIPSLESSTPSNSASLQKKQPTVVRGTISHTHKLKENNASISPSMCFFTSAFIDGLTVNGLLLVVEAFAMFFYLFYLILFLQREENCKCDNTNISENVTKVCQ